MPKTVFRLMAVTSCPQVYLVPDYERLVILYITIEWLHVWVLYIKVKKEQFIAGVSRVCIFLFKGEGISYDASGSNGLGHATKRGVQ